MTSSLALVLSSVALLISIATASTIADQFVITLDGNCNSSCRNEIRNTLKSQGRVCKVSPSTKMNTLSFVSVDCSEEKTKGSRGSKAQFSSASQAKASSAKVSSALRGATTFNLSSVDPEQTMRAYCELPDSTPPALTSPTTPVTSDAEPVPADVWGVDEVDGNDDGKRCPSSSNLGNGIDVFILDTGCTPDVGGLCLSFVNGESTCNDLNGHGDHVAGTATGATFGMAPKATRHCIKVLDQNSDGFNSDIMRGVAAAVNYCKRNGRPCIINLSLGGDRSDSFNRMLNDVSGSGVYFAIAAGNKGRDACEFSPASATTGDDFIFSVAGHDIGSGRYVFSNYGRCTDLSGPAVNVRSVGGLFSGTSMAAPHVAGAMAVILSDSGTPSLQSLTKSRRMITMKDGELKPALQISC